MSFKIFFVLPNGETDNVIISGETIEEIQTKAQEEIKWRGAIDAWSEECVG